MTIHENDQQSARRNIQAENSAPMTTISGAVLSVHHSIAPMLSLAQTMIEQLVHRIPKSNMAEVQYDLNSYYNEDP